MSEPEVEDLRAEVVALKAEIARREHSIGVAKQWVETLRKADKATIVQQESDLIYARPIVMRARAYVHACLAIRYARFPSQDFTLACTKASECYRDLVKCFEDETL
jgi:hypothetical protein